MCEDVWVRRVGVGSGRGGPDTADRISVTLTLAPILVSVAFELYWMGFPAVGQRRPYARLLAFVPSREREMKCKRIDFSHSFEMTNTLD